MMNFNDMLAKVRDLYAARFEPGELRVLADIYWRMALGLAAVAVAGALAWGGWQLVAVMNDLGTPPSGTLPPAPGLDRSALEATVQAIQNRQTQFQTLQATPAPAIPDPGQ